MSSLIIADHTGIKTLKTVKPNGPFKPQMGSAKVNNFTHWKVSDTIWALKILQF